MLKISDKNHTFEVEEKNGQLLVNGEFLAWDIQALDKKRYHGVVNAKSYNLELVKHDVEANMFVVKLNGKRLELKVKNSMDQLLERLGISATQNQRLNELKAPMPGQVLNIVVKEGQAVAKGDPLIVLEAMKMENVLKATGDGVVAKIHVKQGENVEKNHKLLTFE